MPRFPPLGVEAVVENHAGYISKLGEMSKATRDTHGVLSTLGSVPLGGLVTGAAAATTAIAAIGAAAVAAGAVIGAALFKAAETAAPLFDIQQAFEGINEAAGRSSATVLQLWQDASRGAITAIDLMLNFNTATQLLGDTLTEQLPAIFPAIAKVAAATGQSVTALTNDFIRGIGRESIMILDNLGITLDLSQVMQGYADVLGITVEEMSKAQRQQALLTAATEILTRNTANLPDAAETAQGQFARLRVTIQDLKDDILISLVPAMLPLVARLGELAKQFLPQVAEFVISKLIPALGELVTWFADHIPGAIQTVIDFYNQHLKGVFEAVVAFLQEKIPLAKDFLVSAFDKIKLAWQGVVDLWNDHLKGVFEKVVEFLESPAGVGTFFEDIQSGFEDVQGTLDDVTASGDDFRERFLSDLPPLDVSTLLTDLGNVNGTLQDVAQSGADFRQSIVDLAQSFLESDVFATIKGVTDVLVSLNDLGFRVLNGVLQNSIIPALTNLWSLFRDAVLPVLNDVWDFISSKLKPIFDDLGGSINGVESALDPVIDFLRDLSEALTNLELPDWLEPGSPSPLEKTLGNIRKSLEAISSVASPALGGFNAPVRTSGANAPQAQGMSFAPAYNLTVHTAAGTPRIAADFRLMQALSRR